MQHGMGDACGAKVSTDDEVWRALDAANLAHVTKQNHSRRLRFLTRDVYSRRTKTPLLHLLGHPAYALKAIEAHSGDPHTRKTYVSSILACFKHCPALRGQLPRELERWQSFERQERQRINDQMMRNEPTATQQRKAVAWDDVRDLPYRMPEGSFERLMVALYVLQEPNRNDYSPCSIATTEQERAECQANQLNCVKLGANPEVCIAFHKTRGSRGVIRKPMTDALKREIEASLEHFPRQWLFCDIRNPNHPWSKQYFRQNVAKTFERWIGKRVGPSTLRHAFINGIDWNTTTLKQASEYARNMGHSMTTLRKYHFAGQGR